MCNEYKMRARYGDIGALFERIAVSVTWSSAEPNRPPNRPFKPTNRAPILRPVDPANPFAGIEGIDLRWWLVPGFHKKTVREWRSMCTNARIETVDTAASFRGAYKGRRCLVPVTSFIEYDEPPDWKKGEPKRRWEASWADGEPRFFAGLWERSHPSDFPDGLESFTFVTGDPGGDLVQVHDRQPFLLNVEQGMRWLDLTGPGKALLQHPPVGSYIVRERARELDADLVDPAAPGLLL